MEFVNKITGYVLALVLGAILVGGLLIPTVQGMTETEKTFTNEGYYTMDAITEETARVIEWEKATPNILKIDGTDLDMSWTDQSKSYTLIGSEEMVLRYERGANNTAGLQLFSTTAGATYISFHSNSSSDAGDKVTVTLTAGTVTFVTNGTNPFNKTVSNIGTDAYVINPTNSGDYALVMKKADIPAHLNGESTIRFIGVSVTSGPNGIALYGIGSLDDGMTLSTIYTNTTVSDVSYTNLEAFDEAVDGYLNLYSLDKYTFTINYTDNGTPKTFDATYSYFLVPAEVTAEKSWHLDTTEIAMFGVISILGIIMLVVIAANAIRNKY